MTTSLQNPKVLANTFCNNGNKTDNIPAAATGTNACSLEEGFPVITSTAISQGGIPPKRTDFNGILNLLSQYCFFLQNGGKFKFNSSVASAIGGYPEGAILEYTNSNGITTKIKSLVNNNTNQPTNSNIKSPTSPAGTYYWEYVSNVFDTIYLNSSKFGFPDFTAIVEKSVGVEYTATENGFVYAIGTITTSGGTVYLSVNNVKFSLCIQANYDSGALFIPVSKGDVYIISNTAGGLPGHIRFVPCK